jgi:hypothetical protein
VDAISKKACSKKDVVGLVKCRVGGGGGGPMCKSQ